MKILKINTAYMQNGEHLQYNEEIADEITVVDVESLTIAPQVQEWQSCLNDENSALMKITRSLITEDIKTIDKRRSRAFRGLVDCNRAMLNHFDPAKLTDVRYLQVIFDTYGNIANMGMSKKTGLYDNFLQELSSETAERVLNTLRLTEWITELAAANNEVHRYTRMRTSETAKRTGIVVKDARQCVDAAFDVLAERINALMIVEGSDGLAQLISRINVIIEKYGNIIATRRGRNKA